MKGSVVGRLWFAILLGWVIVDPPRGEAGFLLTAEDPGVQRSRVAGVTTEDFDRFPVGTTTRLDTAVGMFTSPGLAIVAPDVYGGAGGVGRYFSVGVQSGQFEARLLLAGGTPQAYFGFWWSAADPANQIDFYLRGSRIASFNRPPRSGPWAMPTSATPTCRRARSWPRSSFI